MCNLVPLYLGINPFGRPASKRAVLYTSTTTQISHVNGISVVKQVLARVKACCSSPQETLTMKTDFFGDELTPDNWLMKLQQKPIDEDLFMSMMKNCLTAIVTVLEKQYR
jgi:hypothetical protein